jgi:hypothetical protein
LVVAVSEYGYGDPAWNRSALDQDALRFRDWLLGRDVPQDNILCLIGSSATPERVREALTEEVPQWRGDHLWVYWAGHGLLDDDKQLRLLLAGCPAADKRNLRLTDLLRLYRTKVLPGFARQQFIVDSCRLFASDQAIRGLSGPLDLLSPGTEQAVSNTSGWPPSAARRPPFSPTGEGCSRLPSMPLSPWPTGWSGTRRSRN